MHRTLTKKKFVQAYGLEKFVECFGILLLLLLLLTFKRVLYFFYCANTYKLERIVFIKILVKIILIKIIDNK